MRRLRKLRIAREEANRDLPPMHGPLMPLVGWKKYCADLMANPATTVRVDGNEKALTASTAAELQEIEMEANNDAVTLAAPLTNLQVANFSIEFEDPQHPLTAVTRTGRRLSSIDNTNVVRPRPSQPIIISNEDRADDDDEDEEVDASYAPLKFSDLAV